MTLKERLSALSEDQRRLLAKRLTLRRREDATAGIVRESRAPSDRVPLSFAQRRFWFLNQLTPLSTAFNVGECNRLIGRLDTGALERALAEVLRRHEVLRATFDVADGEPFQRIAPAAQSVSIPIEDLRELSATQRDAVLQRRLLEESRRPWMLDRGPLIRANLWQIGEQDHVLLVLVHHIVSDGWSKTVLVRELAALYQAFARGEESPFKELPIQYPDFAAWQHRWARSEDFDRQLGYWRENLADLPVLQLPNDGSSVQSDTHGLHKVLVLPRVLSQRVIAIGQQEGATLFMTLLSAFAVLLSRYSGQQDIVVGSPIANRNRAEVEDLIGCFINPLPLRARVERRQTFRQLLGHVREIALGAYAHQDVPFDVLVRTFQPGRASNSSPLFQVMFLLQNLSWQSLQLSDAGMRARPLALGAGVEDGSEFEIAGDLVYPAALEVVEMGENIVCRFEYRTDLAHMLSRAPRHLRRLLEVVVADPDRELSTIDLLDEGERSQLLVEWSGQRARSSAALEPVHRLIEAQATRTPDRKAVCFQERSLTYHELNAGANQLARHLRSLDVGPEVPVGILLPRSVEMPLAVLAVLKAGGAYVPLDPSYPAERLAYIIEDARVRVLLTHSALMNELPDVQARIGALSSVICLDAAAAEMARHDDQNLADGAALGHLAYLIYTSGSTGRPKGTMVSHDNLASAYLAWERAYELRDGVGSHLQMASFSFDVFTGDFVRALCSGGKLVIVPHDLLFAPDKLYRLMRDERVDAAEFVPVVVRDLAKYLAETNQSLDFLRLLIVGSDTWFAGEYADLRRFCGPATRLINSYGVTEATIDSTCFETDRTDLRLDLHVPIGKPFPDDEVYVLDEQLQPVPIGAPGELFIGGAGVARGYFRRPDLTAEKFVPHPFSTEPGARLYRTGDLARFLPEGSLAFLGRADHQVKLRGFRIELSEVEAVIGQHPAVAQAAAIIREDVAGDRRLVAYVVPAPTTELVIGDLRRFIRDRVPDYMVPSAFVPLASMPVTPNGKVDRGALPAPSGERQLEEAFVAPETNLERVIAAKWRDLLGVDKIGVHDNFFDLGGHSLLLLQLQSRLRDELNAPLTVLDLFKYPTVHSLAGQLTGKQQPSSTVTHINARVDKQRDAIKQRQRLARESKAATRP